MPKFTPPWITEPPPAGSWRALFKWGDPAAYKNPNARLYALLKRTFGLTDEDFRAPRKAGLEPVRVDAPTRLSPAAQAELRAIAGDGNVAVDAPARLAAAYGRTMIDLLRLRDGVAENLPDAVVFPRDRHDVERLVAWCDRHGVPLTPRGGGSSVTRGVECPKGGLSLDLTVHMHRIVRFNETNQTITVEPGLYGPALEQALNHAPEQLGARRRYTCGHFPQSFERSTVGGWIVTRGAGQASTYYGKIEDLVVAQEYVTPAGLLRTSEHPAQATGPDTDQILMGSEGAFGVLTEATLRVFRHRPENRAYFSFVFPDWPSAVAATREVLQDEGGRPAVLRVSDPEETDVALRLYGADNAVVNAVLAARGLRAGRRCLMLGWTEGERGFARHAAAHTARIARGLGALSTTGAVTRAWEHGRYTDPYLRDALQDFGVLTDTLECTVTWDSLERVHEAVRAYCHSRPQTVCMTHMSHGYPQGANLYFIFLAKMDSAAEYLAYQAGILDAIQRAGATMSHHHGIGKMTAPWLEGQLGRAQLELFRALKRHFDPRNVMNPGGTLALDLPEAERRAVAG